MSDLTRHTTYRINENYQDKTKYRFVENAIDEGLLIEVVPDSTLQDIADAWNKYRLNPSTYNLKAVTALLDGLVNK